MGGNAVIDARLLTKVMSDPAYALGLDKRGWTALLTIAHGERMGAALAHRLDGLPVPPKVAQVLAAARVTAESGRTQALWEVEMARRALAPLGVRIILMKGSAYIAAGLDAGRGRLIGDLDILVARIELDKVEAALITAGWEWVKPDPYDDAYYRLHMHELPPMIHKERGRMIDVHHTILPLTARPTPDAAMLIAEAEPLENGLYVLNPYDMMLHSIAHLLADGDLTGGLRNLWDIDRLIREFSDKANFWQMLHKRAQHHGLSIECARALRLARHLYQTPVDDKLAGRAELRDIAYVAHLLARNMWGQNIRWFLRQAFYIRSHWLRMPPLMLTQHLWIKWRRK
jgi:hypothetical protein